MKARRTTREPLKPAVEMPIRRIVIGKRHRRDLGDIARLTRNIEEIGLLCPIAVRPDGTLIAGKRRLAAAKALGWSSIPIHVVDLDAVVRGEFAENVHRKDFAPSELVAIGEAVEAVERKRAKERERQGGRTKGSGKLPDPDKGQTRDRTAAQLGVSGRTYEKAKAVVAAARAEPERFGHLVEEMDRSNKVSGAYRALSVALDERRVLSLTPVIGRFRTLIFDPPWQYDMDFLGRGAPDYATMSFDELCALDVGAWAAEKGCHLYLWTTNAMLPHAVALMAAWEFSYKTILTWRKPRWGLGSDFRSQTEHVLFGVRGELHTRRGDISNIFEGPMGKHSAKPERFYEIVRAASYPPYGEAFQRTPRPDFTNLFASREVAA